MTLSKQLIALVLSLLLLIFVGTFFISVQNTRFYLEEQLQSHAQDAATSLGLSISPSLQENDLATVTSMVDAIFDRGYYRSIRVEDMQGKPLVDRVLPVELEGVPGWFVNRFPLSTPVGEASLMRGWEQAGKVVVRSHPGFAYRQLWKNVSDTFWWFLASAGVVLLVGIALLRTVLRPLRQVEQQAEAICNREFHELEELPRTLDLRRIVEAMNRLSRKVRHMLDELQELAEGLRQQAHQSQSTGLANKRHFLDRVQTMMASQEEFSHGLLCLVQLRDLKEYNERNGYTAGDELLQTAARALQPVADAHAGSVLSHMGGADFALLIPDLPQERGKSVGEAISGVLAWLFSTGKLDSPDAGHVGVAWYDGRLTLSELLAEADRALRVAQSEGPNSWAFVAPEDAAGESGRSATEWREYIEQALESQKLELQFQPVVSCPDREPLHREVLLRIREADGSLKNAAEFMPHAEHLGLVERIDRHVIDQLLDRLNARRSDSAERFAVNLAPHSLLSGEFMQWLDQRLASQPRAASGLIFEMSEYGAVAQLERIRQLIELVNRHGAQFSLDHFGRSQSSFAYLKELKVDYLKIDGSYLRSLDESPQNPFFVHAVAEIAHGLEIRVIAESVETQETWDRLAGMSVDGAQGYFIGRPESEAAEDDGH